MSFIQALDQGTTSYRTMDFRKAADLRRIWSCTLKR